MRDIKVSVCCLAYNHEPYIRQCLDGFVMQKCNFIFEVLIHDDASTDNTAKIIKEYEAKYSEIIKPIYQTENQHSKGIKATITYNFPRAKGKFIALCEGDDYWTDPLKLQKQVDFLKANEEYAICFHPISVLRNGILEEDKVTVNIPETTSILDLAKQNYMHTCSVVYRNNLITELPDYFTKAPVGDYFLHLLNARKGKIKLINQKMGVYRLHEKSNWSSKTQEEQNRIWIPFLEKIKPNFNNEVCRIIDDQINSIVNSNFQKNEINDVRNIQTKIIKKIKKLVEKYL